MSATDLTRLLGLYRHLTGPTSGPPLMSEVEALAAAIDEISALRIKTRALEVRVGELESA